MKTPPPFIQIVEKNLMNNVEWSLYMAARGPIPLSHAEGAGVIVSMLFYLGDLKHAKEVSYIVSTYWEKQAAKSKLKTYRVLNLFKSALYRSLAEMNDEALALWREVVENRQKIPEEILRKQRMVHLLVYEAYALAKLKRYSEVSKPAQKGFIGINKGKSVYLSSSPYEFTCLWTCRCVDKLGKLQN